MKKVWVLLVALVILLPVSLSFAQGDPGKQPVALPDGTTILIPGGWSFVVEDGVYKFTQGQHYFSDTEDIGLFVYLPEITAPWFEAAPTAEELVEVAISDVLELEFDAEQLVTEEDRVEYAFEDDNGQWLIVAQPWGDTLLLTIFHAPADEFEAVKTAVEDIIEQLPQGPAAGAPVECFVSANKSYGVALRLGPGLNRGEYSSLTPNDGQVRVIGQTAADDGSLWWSIEENDPSVNELWVADTDVDKSGNCAMVGQMQGQGIIAPAPGYVAQPPAPAEPGGENPPPAAPGDTSLVPKSGTWYATFAPDLLFSCEGGDTVRVPDIWSTSGTIILVASADGSTLSLTDADGTYSFTRQAPGYYTGNLPSNDPDLFVIWFLHVSSPTSMTSELMVGSHSMPCSGTSPVTMTFIR